MSAAHAIIAEQGLERLSLREVARRLGVSHQAPYKHFASRDHLLAEVIRRCFQQLTRELEGRPRSADPDEDMAAMGRAYVKFALDHPLEYRLMFATPWPGVADHPDLRRDASHALDVLRSALARHHAGEADAKSLVQLDALFIWATLHGLAGILGGEMLPKLGIPRTAVRGAAAHALRRIGDALHDAPDARGARRRG